MASTSSSLNAIFRPTTSTFPAERIINIPCKFYPNCRFGNGCRFIHNDDGECSFFIHSQRIKKFHLSYLKSQTVNIQLFFFVSSNDTIYLFSFIVFFITATANYSSGTNDTCTSPASRTTTTSSTFRRTPSLLNSSNVLNPQAPVFVPNFYKQDFNSNNPPKSYADVVNADRDPLNISDEKEEEFEYHQAMEDSTTL